MRVLFLDIDGILNEHEAQENGFCGITKAHLFNQINLEAKIIVSSAWRYQILRGSMTIKGFENLLLSHGLKVYNRIIGCTDLDETVQDNEWARSKLIARKLATIKYSRVVVLDDMILPGLETIHILIKNGLTEADVIEINRRLK